MARKAVTLKIDGDRELERKLRRLGTKVFTELEDIVSDAAEVLVDEVKARVPRDTGRLGDGIHASKAFAKRGTVEFDVGPDEDGFYGLFAEFGTRFQPKSPFLRPAADAVESEVTAALANGLLKVLSSEDE